MEYGQASKSDIDFDFDSGDDVSAATDASSASPLPKSEIRRVVPNDTDDDEDDEDDLELLRGIGGDDSDYGSDVSLSSDEEEVDQRNRFESVDSEDFGLPIVVPLKTGSDHGDGVSNMNTTVIEPGSRSSRGSRRNIYGDFSRRAPPRTKSGGGLGTSTHSTSSSVRSRNFERRPPGRTKSGEGIADGNEQESNLRRRPPRRTKSGDGSDGLRRRPPPRTKSGSNLMNELNRSRHSCEGAGDGSDGFVTDNAGEDDDSCVANSDPTSPGENGREDSQYREVALQRNMARRQRSSDMLGAMRDATRNMPSRSKSSSGLINGRRQAPTRAKSTDVVGLSELASPGRKPLRRKAPPRTKSGGLMPAPLET